MQQEGEGEEKETSGGARTPASVVAMPDFSAMTEEEQIAYAMQMSLQAATGK